MRYIKAPVGPKGTLEDNRDVLVWMRRLTRDEADRLPDEAAVLVAVDEVSYPHLVVDGNSGRILVRVLVERQSASERPALTVYATEDRYDAVTLARNLEAYITDPCVEVAEPSDFGRLRTCRMAFQRVIGPAEAEDEAACTTDGEMAEVAAGA